VLSGSAIVDADDGVWLFFLLKSSPELGGNHRRRYRQLGREKGTLYPTIAMQLGDERSSNNAVKNYLTSYTGIKTLKNFGGARNG